MNTANLGSMVVRLAMEMAGYKEGWSDAARTAESGAKQIEAAGRGVENAGKSIGDSADHVTAALTRQAAVFGVVAAGAALVARAYQEGHAENAAFVKTLAMTGNAAGTTADHMSTMAKSISAIAGTQANAAAALNVMASVGKVASNNLQEFTLVAVRADRVLGTSVADTAKHFAMLGEQPVKASLRLNESMNYLTESTYKQIKAAEVMGRADEAAAIAKEAYSNAVKAATEKVEASLNPLERAWIRVKDAAAKAWDSMLDIGRPKTMDQQLKAAQTAVEQMEATVAGRKQRGLATGDIDPQLEAAKQNLVTLREANRLGERALQIAADKSAYDRGRIALGERLNANLNKEHKLTRDLAEANEFANATFATAKEREALLETARQKNADRARKEPDLALKEARRVAEERQQLRIKEDAEITKFFQHQNEEAVKAAKLQEELLGKRIAEYQKGLDAQVRKSYEAVQAAQAEHDAYGRSKSAVAELTLAKLEETRVTMIASNERYEDVEAINAQIDAQKKLIDIFKKGEVREAFDKNAKDIADKLQRTQEQFYEGLMSSAMKGGKSLWEYVKGLFRSAALTIVLNPIMAPLSGLVASMTAPAAAAAGGSVVGGIGTGLTGFNLLNGGMAGMGAGVMNGLSAWGAGGSVSGVLSNPGLYSGAELFGTALPILAGVGALFALAKSFKGETRAGGQYGYAINGAGVSNRRGTTYSGIADGAFFMEGPSGGDPYRAEAMAGINSTVDAMNARFKGLGLSTTVTNFNAGYETSDKDRGGVFSGGMDSTGRRFGETGQGDNYAGTLFESTSTRSPDAATATANYATDLVQVSIQSLQGLAGLPATLAKMLQTQSGEWIDAEALSADAATKLLGQVDLVINSVNALSAAAKLLPFENLKDLTFDAAAGLMEFAGGIQALNSNLNAYYQNFYSEQERQAQALKNLGVSFASLGLPMIDLTQGNEAARAAFRDLVDSQDLSTESGQKAYAGLLALAGAFASLTPVLDQTTQAAEDAAQALIDRQDKAYAALQRAIDAAQQVKQEAIDSLRDLFEMLGSEVSDLRGEVASTRSARAAGGRQFIDQALASMQATGYAPDAGQLSDAIGAARADLDPSRYASQFEYERDTLVLAGKLEKLQAMTGDQLTTAEQELECLNSLERSAEQQYNVLRGIEDNTLDLSVALQEWIDSQKAGKAPAASAAKPAAPGGAVFGGGSNMGGGADQPSNAKYKRAVSLGTAGWADRDVLDPTEIAGLDELAKIYRGFDGTGDLAGLLTAVKEAGYRLTDLQAVTGFAYVDWLNAANSVGIQAFAMGGSFAGGARIVGERGPELEITGPSRIYSAEQTRAMFGGSGALAEVMREANLDRRAEALATLEQLRRQTKLLEYLERWEAIGMPRERALL